MIDIRCHILHGTECGPDSFSESVEMCRAAIASKVRVITATPRWKAGNTKPPLPFDEMARKIQCLQAEVGGALSFTSGFVLDFSDKLPDLVDNYGSSLALAGMHHLLISLPHTSMPLDVEDVLRALARRGFVIIVANPECCPTLRRNPLLLTKWFSHGVKFQIDAASITGRYGRELQRFAVECLRKFDGSAAVASSARSSETNAFGAARAKLISSIGKAKTLNCVREIPMEILGENGQHGRKPEVAGAGVISLLKTIRPIRALFSGS